MQKIDYKETINYKVFKKALQYLSLRFENAKIVEITGEDKGNVSNYRNGKKPVPESFLANFFTTFNLDKSKFLDEVAKEEEIKIQSYPDKTTTQNETNTEKPVEIEDYKLLVKLLKEKNKTLEMELESCKEESRRLKKHTDDVS